MLDDFRRRQRAEPSALLRIAATRQTREETGGEQIARAGRVHHLIDGERRHHVDLAVRS